MHLSARALPWGPRVQPPSCCPSCPYETKCDGNVLKSCSVGVDQMVGKPSQGAAACQDPNPVCATLDERNAQCAMDDTTECDQEFIPRCEGGLVVACALAPLTNCDPEQVDSRCEGDMVIACTDGYLQAQDCSLGIPGGTCEESESDYGHSAYCTGSWKSRLGAKTILNAPGPGPPPAG